MDEHVSREIVYETTATAPPEELHRFFLACREDGFQPARRRLRELLDRFGLAGTDLVNQLHRGLGDVPFLTESQKLSVTLRPWQKLTSGWSREVARLCSWTR